VFRFDGLWLKVYGVGFGDEGMGFVVYGSGFRI
jgi:hypothetical protein